MRSMFDPADVLSDRLGWKQEGRAFRTKDGTQFMLPLGSVVELAELIEATNELNPDAEIHSVPFTGSIRNATDYTIASWRLSELLQAGAGMSADERAEMRTLMADVVAYEAKTFWPAYASFPRIY